MKPTHQWQRKYLGLQPGYISGCEVFEFREHWQSSLSVPTLPEVGLVQAILEQAVADVCHCAERMPRVDNYTRQIGKDAAGWFLDEADTPGSFLWACRVLRLDEVAVRDAVGRTVTELCQKPQHKRYYNFTWR